MLCRFLEARLEEADARRSSFEKQARQIVQSTKDLRRSTSSDLQRCASAPSVCFSMCCLEYPVAGQVYLCGLLDLQVSTDTTISACSYLRHHTVKHFYLLLHMLPIDGRIAVHAS